jgi:hypothetical protein
MCSGARVSKAANRSAIDKNFWGCTPYDTGGDRAKIENQKLRNRKIEKSEIENRRIADFAKGKRKAGKRCKPFETCAKALEKVALDRSLYLPFNTSYSFLITGIQRAEDFPLHSVGAFD